MCWGTPPAVAAASRPDSLRVLKSIVEVELTMGNASDAVDVLIVGGGTSGGVAARHFAENGFSVLCLEQGDWMNMSDLPGDKPEYELTGGKQWHPDPNQRQRREDYPCDNSESDVIPWMYNGVGGGSVLYAACWSRL